MRTFSLISTVLLTAVLALPNLTSAATSVEANSAIFTVLKLTGNKAYIQQKGAKPLKIKDSLSLVGNLSLADGKTVDGVDVSALNTTVTNLTSQVSALPSPTTYTAGTGIAINSGVISSTITDTNTTYTAGSGLSLAGTSFSLLDTCTTDQVLKFNGTAWACAADANSGTTYTAGTGIGLVGTTFSATLGTDITSAEIVDSTIAAADLGPDSVDASELASTAIQSGDIGAGDLPADGYGSTYLNTTGDTATGIFAVDGATLTSNGVPGQIPSMYQIPKGITATTLSSTDTVGQYSAMTIGIDGLPVIAFYNATGTKLQITKCTTATCSALSTPVDLDTGTVGQYASIAIGSDGVPVVAYYAAGSTTFQDLKVVRCSDYTCTAAGTPQTVDSTNNVGLYTSITIGANGFPVISYQLSTSNDLKVVACTAVDCSTANTPVAFDTASAVGQYTSIAIGTDGFPIISYYDTAGALKVLHCTTATCSAANSPTALVTSAGVGQYTSITIGDDGLPVISYYDSVATALYVAKCANVACSSATLTLVDNSGTNSGDHTSITIGTSGFPMIAYRADNTLKIATCGTDNCSQVSLATVDSGGGNTVGLFTSITIGKDGLPVVSYQDSTAGDLKVYKASNPYNVNYWTRR